MSLKELVETARAMVENDKGLLAMDESTPTCFLQNRNGRSCKAIIPRVARKKSPEMQRAIASKPMRLYSLVRDRAKGGGPEDAHNDRDR